jgi:hypothetical protein
VPDEKTPSQRWVERTLADGSRECGPWPPGEGGTITFLVNGNVAIGAGGQVFEEQKKKVISRFNVDAVLLANLDKAFCEPSDILLSQILREIFQTADQTRFNRHLDALVSTVRALRELWLKRFKTATGSRFINAVQVLARKHKRPPTKAEITEHLCCELSQTSKWCRDHGFEWLPNAPAGRRRTGRRRSC